MYFEEVKRTEGSHDEKNIPADRPPGVLVFIDSEVEIEDDGFVEGLAV